MNNQETEKLAPKEFTRVALLTSYPLYWRTGTVDATIDDARAIHRLIQLFLEFPGGSLGVSRESGSWSWLDPQVARQWNDETRQKFEDYALRFQNAPSESRFLREFNDRQCMFFAPFNPQSFLEVLRQQCNGEYRHEELYLEIEKILNSIDWTPYTLFWSFSLNQFKVSNDRLIYTPMLALWSSYPRGGYWAPPLSHDLQVQPHPSLNLSLDEARSLLREVMWNKLETVFTNIRDFCGLGIANLEFANFEVSPPVFYFAQYINPPSCPEDLATRKLDSLYPLVKACLGSDDPFAREVSAGVLEGDFITLRRTHIANGVHPRYLIFPFLNGGKTLTEQELENDLFFISNQFSYLEFSISHESRDIYSQCESLLLRQQRWAGTLNGLSQLVNNAICFLPTIHNSFLRKVYLEMERLSLLLWRIQSLLERLSIDAAKVRRSFDSCRDDTEDFWYRNLTYSSCPNTQFNDLRESLLDAYPYHYLKQPLQSLKELDDQLLGGVGRSVEIVDSMLKQADRMTQESLEVWTRRLGIIAALAAPVLALPNFIELKLDAESFSKTLLGRFFHNDLSRFQALVGCLLGAALALLFVASIAFVISWLWNLVSEKKAERFISGIRSFENLVKQSESSRDDLKKLEKLDTEASQILSSLWAEAHSLQNNDTQGNQANWLFSAKTFLKRRLRIAQRRKGLLAPIGTQVERWISQAECKEVDDWLRQSQYFRYLVYLFVLTPNRIPLPRTLCIYRYKARGFISGITISNSDFQSSLGAAGFNLEMIQALDRWLQGLYDRDAFWSIGVDDFVDALEQRGVRAYPNPAAVQQWYGPLNAGITS